MTRDVYFFRIIKWKRAFFFTSFDPYLPPTPLNALRINGSSDITRKPTHR